MSNAVSGLLGALVGGLAAIAGAALQARSAARLQRAEAAEREKQREAGTATELRERRRLLARWYLYQLEDAVQSLLRRVENWAHRGGPDFAEGRYPGYWDVTSLYALARALGAERLLALEGIYVELEALASGEKQGLPSRAVEEAVREAFGHDLFYYHRLALGEAALDRPGEEFRLLTYSEFLRRYEDPAWDLKSLVEPVRNAFNSLTEERLTELEQALTGLTTRIEGVAHVDMRG
jgi:hypothetical protein